MRIVGFYGMKNCGKSFVANNIKTALQNEFGRKAIIVPFADPLKSACYTLFGATRKENYWGNDADKAEPNEFWKARLGEEYSTYRKILISVGASVFRKHVHERFWIWAFQATILKLRQTLNPDFIFIDDVRFTNEAEFILNECSGTIYNVVRQGITLDNSDIAENSMDQDLKANKFFTIPNNGPIESFKLAREILRTTKECPDVFSV